MPALGSVERPLRVAIVGSGPSGFYACAALFKLGIKVKVDMFDRLPTPFGLVRYGVAPDHLKIKNVVKIYEKEASRPEFTFFGNVQIGDNVAISELKQFYDAIVVSTGAKTDRKLDIPGEDFPGSFAATELVGWYNGHPDFQNLKFDFSHEVAVVIGQGNVAMDVSRILLKTVNELRNTDITSKALEALASNKIKDVHCIGRRGPVQAAFTADQIREFTELSDINLVIDPEDLVINEASQKELEEPAKNKNYEILKKYSQIPRQAKKRNFFLHFFKSPVEITGNKGVQSITLEKNRLTGEPFKQKVLGTGIKDTIECGLVFRSVGYKGVPVNGLPFEPKAGIIPNQKGRVMDSKGVVPGFYTSGWIKLGASGVIGTNKADSEETINSLYEDIQHLAACPQPSTQAVGDFLKSKKIRAVSFLDWKKIDAAEVEQGLKNGKPREKFVNVNGMLSVL